MSERLKIYNLTQTGQQTQEILNKAKGADDFLQEIKDEMQNLPDGSAVSAQVALNTVAIEGLQGDVSELGQKLIKLAGMGDDASLIIHSVGEVFYNTSTRLLRKCVGVSPLSFVTVPFYDGAIYTYSNDLYIWDGTDLKPTPNITVGGEQIGAGGVESINISGVGYNFRDAKAPLIENDEEYEGFSITDRRQNTIVKFKDGDFRTKNFDSRTLRVSQTSDCDFAISDENSKIVLEIKDGDIKTRNFNSKNLPSSGQIETINLTSAYRSSIVSTSRNYIIKDDGINLYISNNLGMSYNIVPHNGEVEIGNVAFVHFFRDGRILLCDNEHCFYSDDLFSTINVSEVLDYGGVPFTPTSKNHFFRLGNYNSEYHTINNTEVLAWNDYSNNANYVSRVWYTDDLGVTIKCILKKGETLDSDGNLINPNHFHRTFIDDTTSTIYVTSGDTNAETVLVHGTLNGSNWSWDVIGQGTDYKFGQLTIKDGIAYCITDYTDNVRDTGIIMCPVNKLSEPSNFSYLYKTENKNPVSAYYEDAAGNRCIFPDGIGYKMFWYAKGSFNFRRIGIIEDDGENWAPMCFIGPNYNGDAIVLAAHGYSDSAFNISQRDRYLFARSMREAGIDDFCKQINIIL